MKIGRLRDFRKRHPNSWGALLRGALQDEAVPKAIVTMFERYRAHPEVDPAGATSPSPEPIDLNDPEAPRLYDTEPIRVPAAAAKQVTRPLEKRELVDILEAEELAADARMPRVKQHPELERVEAAAPPPLDVSAEPMADPFRAAGEGKPRVRARTIRNVSHETADVDFERSEAAAGRAGSVAGSAIPREAVAPASGDAKPSAPGSTESRDDPRRVEVAGPPAEIGSAMAALVENHADSLLLSPDERRRLRGCLGEPQTVFAALHHGRFPCLCTEEPVLTGCLVAWSERSEADDFIDGLYDLAVARCRCVPGCPHSAAPHAWWGRGCERD
jgi:hypothetical protein